MMSHHKHDYVNKKNAHSVVTELQSHKKTLILHV